MFNEPFRNGRNGSEALGSLVESHLPLDILIIALGANDLKPIYNTSGYESALGIQKLISIAKVVSSNSELKIVVMAPTKFGALNENLSKRFKGAHEKFPHLLAEYKRAAEENGAYFFDSNQFIVLSVDDGVHLDSESYIKLGVELSKYIEKFYKL